MRGHGGSLRGLETTRQVSGGRFGRMFDVEGPEFPDGVIESLAAAMIRPDAGAPIDRAEPEDENPAIPAGYTYFGQFVDHDITFDPTPLRHQAVDVEALEDYRTPALDLDSVYGRGPDDQPYLYDGVRLRPGLPVDSPGALVGTHHDLLRLPPDARDRSVAVIGDRRNDENKLVAQMHGTMAALHNRLLHDTPLLERLGGDTRTAEGRFRIATTAARWHYQWVVLFDFLAGHVCHPGVVERILNAGGTPRLRHYARHGPAAAYLPVEFSGAAYRFGHSMVRPGYALNQAVGADAVRHPHRIPTFDTGRDPRDNLNGGGMALPSDWGIDWAFFLDGIPTRAPRPALRIAQPSYRIDASLAGPLGALPEFRDSSPAATANLAYRNLARGNMLRLPSGEQVAERLGLTPPPPDVLWSAGSRTARAVPGPLREVAALRRQVFERHRRSLQGCTPLWYYVLREAEFAGVERIDADPARDHGGQHLGPVGSRLLAETFIGLLWFDRTSFLHHPLGFRPLLPDHTGRDFRLADLVSYALSS